MIAQALQALRPGAEWVIIGDTLKWMDTEQTRPTDEEIEEKMAELERQAKVESTQNRVITLCDRLQDESEIKALGYKPTPRQLQRLESKYERAKNGAFSAAKRAKIISDYESFTSTMDAVIDVSEDYREYIFNLIDSNQIGIAKQLLSDVENIADVSQAVAALEEQLDAM